MSSKDKYISLVIDGVTADLDPAGTVPTVTYSLEDEQDFEVKDSANSFNTELPATLTNDQIHNTYHNPSVMDKSVDQSYDNFKSVKYIANGQEILVGKYLLQSATKQFGRVQKYKGMLIGLNGDWVIDLKEKTLLDFVNPTQHTFDAATIINSWNYNGRNQTLDYLYAPVRYQKRFGDIPAADSSDADGLPNDDNVIINDLKPMISPYWILYRAFKSVGYKLVSTFLDTDYYRRGLLPWTWGGFDFIDDTRWEPLKFLASQEVSERIEGTFTGYPTAAVTNVPGAFDNSGLYSYTGPGGAIPNLMVWKYPTAPANLNLGKVRVNLSVQIQYDYKIQQNSDAQIIVYWYKNGALVLTDTVLSDTAPVGVGAGRNGGDFYESFYEVDINPGDYIGAQVYVHTFESLVGFARINIQMAAFQLNFVKLTDGSVVNLINYSKLNTYKFLDFLGGETDLFDLSFQTDPVRKIVYIEPTHAYKIGTVTYPGYYNRKKLDWSEKEDISKESDLELFSDYEREITFKFQDDTSDGGLKIVQDRNSVTIGLGKYVLPPRFKTDPKENENRFYSATMHYNHVPFAGITGIAPQLIGIIPENISNTSAPESENTFRPKRVWYKGNVSGYGGWRFMGGVYSTIPFVFAVNYMKPSVATDPVLSYSDQVIGGTVVPGLLKKFYLQRMALYRNGRRYNPIYIKLNNYDVANFLHRESIVINDVEYLLVSIKEYNPIDDDSTACTMWAYMPKAQIDLDNTYPSIRAIQSGSTIGTFDIKYWPHLLLTSDILK